MARTRARGRTDDISESSAASESEASAVSGNEGAQKRGRGQQQRSLVSGVGMLVDTQVQSEQSESEMEQAAPAAIGNGNNARRSPRKKASLSARKSTGTAAGGARAPAPPLAAPNAVDQGKGKRVFKPARSARKTTAPSSSASKQQQQQQRARAAVANAFAESSISDAESESDALQSEAEETQYQTAPVSQKRRRSEISTRRQEKSRAVEQDANDDDEEEDGNDTTMWVPVDSPDDDEEEEEEANVDPEFLAKEARAIIERAFKGDFIRLSKKKRSTLSSFLHSMDTQDNSNQDAEVEARLLRAFELSIKDAGPDFSLNELLDITAYVLVFSNPNDAETPTALVQGLPLALDNFASSLVPQGIRLTPSILQLQLMLRIQLILARARVTGEILEEDNLDIMDEDQNLAVRFVDDGQEALWDEHQRRSAQIIATILDGDSDIDDLVAEYPIEDFLTAFLKHVKRVFGYLRRPILAASTIASSPSKYYEHIARKRLKVDEARRRSAPPPQRGSSAQVESPYSHLRESLRNARRSSPVRRHPLVFDNTNPRPFQAIGTSRFQDNQQQQQQQQEQQPDQSIREDSDEEVQNELITRSSVPIGSEQDNEPDETIVQERIAEEEAEASMSTEEKVEEVEVEVQVEVETQTVETQAVPRNLLDRSALGAFLETQADMQEQQQENSQDAGEDFWGNELVNGDNGTEAPMAQDDMGLYDNDPFLADSQASQAVPGRSDAPSPSLANPQSYDGGFDPSEQDQLASDGANGEVELELEEENAATPRANGEAGHGDAADDEEEGSANNGETQVEERSGGSGTGSPAAETQSLPQSLPPRRGAKKGSSWFERQDDAERISMSSPAEKGGRSAASKRAAHARAARKSTVPSKQSTIESAEGEDETQEQNGQVPPSARTTNGTRQTRRKALEYVEVEAGEGEDEEGEEESEDPVEVLSSRQNAKENAAASAPAPVKRRPGRPRKNAVDPEQGTSRATLPTRKSGRTSSAAAPSAASAGSGQEQGDENEDEENADEQQATERNGTEDDYVDELEGEEEPTVPVASTSTARATRRRSGRASAAAAVKKQPTSSPQKPTVTYAKPKPRPAASSAASKAKGKGKARATSAAATEATEDDEGAQGEAGELLEDDGLNDVDQLREKRELFAEAMKAWREGLVQSDRFKEIKEQYNSITLMHPTYVDKPAQKKTGWSALERKIFLVALDLMRNPFASRRYKSILQDHGINGVVTRGLKDRKSSQLKDKGENIRHLHQNHPVDNPAFAFFQDQLEINGTIVHAASRKKKKSGGGRRRGKSEADDDDEIEDADEDVDELA